MGRGLYKQPGGKLVGVSVRLSDDIPAYFRECASSIQSVEQCRIDGDFFLDGDDKDSRRLLQDWENLLQSQRGAPTRDITRRLQAITANYPNARLVGMTAEGIATLGPVVETMAEGEGLLAHKLAATVRIEQVKKR